MFARRPNVVRARSTHIVEDFRCIARDGLPRRALPVENMAVGADNPDVVCTTSPYGIIFLHAVRCHDGPLTGVRNEAAAGHVGPTGATGPRAGKSACRRVVIAAGSTCCAGPRCRATCTYRVGNTTGHYCSFCFAGPTARRSTSCCIVVITNESGFTGPRKFTAHARLVVPLAGDLQVACTTAPHSLRSAERRVVVPTQSTRGTGSDGVATCSFCKETRVAGSPCTSAILSHIRVS